MRRGASRSAHSARSTGLSPGPRSYRVVLFSWDADSGITSTPAAVMETLRPRGAVELHREAWRLGLHLGLLHVSLGLE